MLGNKSLALDTLRRQVATLEAHPALTEAARLEVSAGLFATPRGVVHEVFSDSLVNAGAALGFALGQAKGLMAPERPGVLILQLRSEMQETGLPYGMGFRRFGFDPQAVVLIRTATVTELLWAVEEAIACRAVAAVVADMAYEHKALDFTASRRMALRATASGGAVFLVRYAQARQASAARFRWKIEPAPSHPPPFDSKAPGSPRWRITLEKGRLGPRRKGEAGENMWLIDWTENGFAIANQNRGELPRLASGAALPRAAFAALGDRLPETG